MGKKETKKADVTSVWLVVIMIMIYEYANKQAEHHDC